jgi:hypothetical protein
MSATIYCDRLGDTVQAFPPMRTDRSVTTVPRRGHIEAARLRPSTAGRGPAAAVNTLERGQKS